LPDVGLTVSSVRPVLLCRCKHFMIDQDSDQQYIVVGNDRTFPSLNEVVAFHSRHPVTDDGDTLLVPCPTSGPRDDLAELE
jgi:hypothetical protein